MSKSIRKTDKFSDLRERAEALLSKSGEQVLDMSAEDIKKLVYELGTHQIELELQNDDLKKTQVLLEESRTNYYELFDLAPCGYLKLNQKGFIIEANLTATELLGTEKTKLINRKFTDFIADEYQDVFYKIFSGNNELAVKKNCDLKLKRSKDDYWVHLEFKPVSHTEETFESYLVTIEDINAQKIAEKEISDLAKFPEENTNPVFRVSDEGILLNANPASVERIFGENTKPGTKMPEKWNEPIQQVLQLNKKRSIEMEVDRITFLFELIPIVESKYLNVYGKDITQRKKSKEKNVELLSLLNLSNDSIFVIKPETSRLLYVNDKACQSLGYTRDELLSLKITDIDPVFTDAQYWDKFVAEFKKTENIILESEHITKDGARFPIEISASYVVGKEDRIFAVVRDITERKKAEEKLKKLSVENEEANKHAMYMLAIASEYKDHETGEHINRIVELTKSIALEMGVEPVIAEKMGTDSILHDLGKIAIPDHIILKPTKLTDKEFETMKKHTVIGAEVIGKSEWFSQSREIALYHHERWDGKGYPEGLANTNIPVAARIVAVADVFDALVSKRPYKEAWTLQKAIEEIKRETESHFDPEVVKVFLNLYENGRLNDYFN